MGSFRIDQAVARAADKRLVMKSLLVYQQNKKLGEFYWTNSAKRRQNVESTAKSVTGLAVGIAVEEGIIKLSDKPADYFRQYLEPGYNPLIEDLTVEHMLKMACGHNRALQIMPSAERDYISDWIHHAMNIAVEEQPGVTFHYDNSGPYLISAMISVKTGEKLVDWLKPRLFSPLEIPNPQWFTCPVGHNAASGSLFLSPEEMGRIGQLYLDKGMWQGKRLVSAEWIEMATQKQIDTNLPENPPIGNPLAGTSFCGKDAASGYGYLIWMCADGKGYRSHGNYNQNFIVIPEKQAVVVTTADENRGQEILDIIWEEIYTQL